MTVHPNIGCNRFFLVCCFLKKVLSWILSPAELPTPAPLIYSDGTDPHESADYKVRRNSLHLFQISQGTFLAPGCTIKIISVSWGGFPKNLYFILVSSWEHQRFGFHLWLTEITVRWHFDALPQSEPKNPDTQDSSLDSLEELMRGNVDITVPSMIQNPRLLSWCCCTCFWSGFSKTANT